MQTAVKSRFDQDDLHILRAAERFILNEANKQYCDPDNLVKDLVKLS
jgi:hypothetical protein